MSSKKLKVWDAKLFSLQLPWKGLHGNMQLITCIFQEQYSIIMELNGKVRNSWTHIPHRGEKVVLIINTVTHDVARECDSLTNAGTVTGLNFKNLCRWRKGSSDKWLVVKNRAMGVVGFKKLSFTSETKNWTDFNLAKLLYESYELKHLTKDEWF